MVKNNNTIPTFKCTGESDQYAIHWLMKAADQGHFEGLELLKTCFDSNRGINESNFHKIRSFLEMSQNEVRIIIIFMQYNFMFFIYCFMIFFCLRGQQDLEQKLFFQQWLKGVILVSRIFHVLADK